MVPPPPEWLPAIEAASMLYSGQADLGALIESEHRKLPLYPNFGNGYFGGFFGCFAADVGGEGPTAVPGVIHVAGVFTGKSTTSHRAESPGVFSVYPVSAGGTPVAFGGSSLDLAAGVFINRTLLPGCGARVVLEQRWYAHRSLRNLLVYEVELLPPTSGVESHSREGSCSVTFSGCNGKPTDTVTTIVSNSSAGVVQSKSQTVASETVGNSRVTIGRVYKQPPATLLMNVTRVPHAHVYLAVLTTSLAEEGAAVAADPVAAAAALYGKYSEETGASLKQGHTEAWAALHSSRIELSGAAGDATATAVAAAVNSSMFYLLSATREDWPFSTSPGGLANNAYLGHTFWDLATWQYPALAPLYPDLGASLLTYREQRLEAAKTFAKQTGYAGARFPWESAVTGANVCGWQTGALYEQHITGDVAMAYRQQYYLTRNDTWLNAHAWPVIKGAAEFWASRFVLDATSRNYTIKDVTGPDESSGKVDDEAYTNAIAAATIAFALEVAAKVTSTPSLPANWSTIVSRVYLPVVSGIYEGGPIHMQDKQYKKGKIITQSAVGLLQYPLEVAMPTQLKVNDLLYWQSHTADNGFYTGDSSYSIAWLALGNRSGSDAQFGRAFLYMNGLPSADNATRVIAPQFNPFNVWKEQARDGNHLNFLTGAGGFLQNVLQGYGGLRARADRLDWQPRLPPHVLTARFVRLSYAGAMYSLSYNATQATLELHGSGARPVSLSVCTPVGSTVCTPLDAGGPAATLATEKGFSLRP